MLYCYTKTPLWECICAQIKVNILAGRNLLLLKKTHIQILQRLKNWYSKVFDSAPSPLSADWHCNSWKHQNPAKIPHVKNSVRLHSVICGKTNLLQLLQLRRGSVKSGCEWPHSSVCIYCFYLWCKSEES